MTFFICYLLPALGRGMLGSVAPAYRADAQALSRCPPSDAKQLQKLYLTRVKTQSFIQVDHLRLVKAGVERI